MNVNTSVRIASKDLEQLRELAKELDRSVSYLISTAIKDYLKGSN